MALWTKARSLEEIGVKLIYAMEAYVECIFLTHGRAWDSIGGYDGFGIPS